MTYHAGAMTATTHRLNLSAIETALCDVQTGFTNIDDDLTSSHDTLSDEVVDNMLLGYHYIDNALALGIDLFKLGNSARLLEINKLILCGNDPQRRKQYAVHLQATETRFYQNSDGIGDLMECIGRHKSDSAWIRAAAAYLYIVSQPQLFIEGNHRTAFIIASYILAHAGHPPFVLTLDNLHAYYSSSTLIYNRDRHSIYMSLQLPRLKREIAKMLQTQSNSRFLIADTH